MVDLADRIDALLSQEEAFYLTEDYLCADHQRGLVPQNHASASAAGESSSHGSSSSLSGINEGWRNRIVEWAYQVCDHFEISREVVGIAMNFLDRFLTKKYVDKHVFQLAAVTCLHLASKLVLESGGKITMDTMIALSRGYFLVDDMKLMELELLSVLGWRVHPPTPYCFSKHMLFFVPYNSITMDTRHDILELARFLTELSVLDYYFVRYKASSIALAALITAMDEIPGVTEEVIQDFAVVLQRVGGLSLQSDDVLDCHERLRLLYQQGGYAPPAETAQSKDRIEAISPVCVSYGLPAAQPPSRGAAVMTNQE